MDAFDRDMEEMFNGSEEFLGTNDATQMRNNEPILNFGQQPQQPRTMMYPDRTTTMTQGGEGNIAVNSSQNGEFHGQPQMMMHSNNNNASSVNSMPTWMMSSSAEQPQRMTTNGDLFHSQQQQQQHNEMAQQQQQMTMKKNHWQQQRSRWMMVDPI